MNAVIPAAMARRLMASMLAKTLATAATPPRPSVEHEFHEDRRHGNTAEYRTRKECVGGSLIFVEGVFVFRDDQVVDIIAGKLLQLFDAPIRRRRSFCDTDQE